MRNSSALSHTLCNILCTNEATLLNGISRGCLFSSAEINALSENVLLVLDGEANHLRDINFFASLLVSGFVKKSLKMFAEAGAAIAALIPSPCSLTHLPRAFEKMHVVKQLG